MRVVVEGVRALRFDDGTVLDVAPVPEVDGHVHEIEMLVLRGVDASGVHLLAVVDDDDGDTPSAELDLRIELP